MESRRTTLYLIDGRKAGSMAARISSTNRPILGRLHNLCPAISGLWISIPCFDALSISSQKYNRKIFPSLPSFSILKLFLETTRSIGIDIEGAVSTNSSLRRSFKNGARVGKFFFFSPRTNARKTRRPLPGSSNFSYKVGAA